VGAELSASSSTRRVVQRIHDSKTELLKRFGSPNWKPTKVRFRSRLATIEDGILERETSQHPAASGLTPILKLQIPRRLTLPARI